MRYLRQFSRILLISALGELLNYFLPFPVPGSVYGMLLMLGALMSGILKVEQVHDAAVFLIDIMPVMFIPAGVGLLESWDVLEPVWLPVAVIIVVTTVLVMAVTGQVTQAVIRKEKQEGKRNAVS